MRVVVAKPLSSAARSSFTSSSVRSNRGRRERKTFFYGLAAAPSFDDDDDYNGGFGFGNASSSSSSSSFSSFSTSPLPRRRRRRGTRLSASKSLFERIADEATKCSTSWKADRTREWYGEDLSVGKDLGEAMKKKKREKKEENEEEEAVRNDEEENGAYQASVNGVASTSESSPKRAIYVPTPRSSSRRCCATRGSPS